MRSGSASEEIATSIEIYSMMDRPRSYITQSYLSPCAHLVHFNQFDPCLICFHAFVHPLYLSSRSPAAVIYVHNPRIPLDICQ